MVKRQIPISTSKSTTIEPLQYRVRDPLGTRGVVVYCCLAFLHALPRAFQGAPSCISTRSLVHFTLLCVSVRVFAGCCWPFPSLVCV